MNEKAQARLGLVRAHKLPTLNANPKILIQL